MNFILGNVEIYITMEKNYGGDYSITKGFLNKIIHYRISLNSVFPLCI